MMQYHRNPISAGTLPRDIRSVVTLNASDREIEAKIPLHAHRILSLSLGNSGIRTYLRVIPPISPVPYPMKWVDCTLKGTKSVYYVFPGVLLTFWSPTASSYITRYDGFGSYTENREKKNNKQESPSFNAIIPSTSPLTKCTLYSLFQNGWQV